MRYGNYHQHGHQSFCKAYKWTSVINDDDPVADSGVIFGTENGDESSDEWNSESVNTSGDDNDNCHHNYDKRALLVVAKVETLM